jgi:hypothetical protein
MRWRLILEEYGPEIIYVKGSINIVADALSRLNLQVPSVPVVDTTDNIVNATKFVMICEANALLYGMEKQTALTDDVSSAFPLTFKHIHRVQRSDIALLKLLQSHDDYSLKIFRGGGKRYGLIVREDKIIIPTNLQRRVVEWYHEYLCHPGETRTEQTIRQHYTWENLCKTVHDICTKCHTTCQLTKKGSKKYGRLPEKVAEINPWDVLCIDLIGTYKIERKNKNKKPLIVLWALTMIDPATKWFEMKEMKTKAADTVSNMLEQAWLIRYP